MQRIITADNGRLKTGMVKDYPMTVWRQISASSKRPLNSFSKSITQLGVAKNA